MKPLALTLIRHAKSSWNSETLTDFERPMSDRGRRDAPQMAARALASLPVVSLVLSSPANRAIATARIFAPVFGIELEHVEVDSRLYDANRKTLLTVLGEIEGNPAHVVLVGHNPGLSELAHTLAKCEFDDLPTCAVVHLQLAIKAWAEIKPNCGSLKHYLYPKDGVTSASSQVAVKI